MEATTPNRARKPVEGLGTFRRGAPAPHPPSAAPATNVRHVAVTTVSDVANVTGSIPLLGGRALAS